MFPKAIHRKIYLFAVVTAPLGLLLGRFPGSLPVVILGANWLLEGNFKNKWQRLKVNPLFYVLMLLFLLYLVGLTYSQNINNGIEEMRIGLPLLAFPLVMLSSDRIGEQEKRWTFISLIVGCVLNTLWCFIYAFVLHSVTEVRELSRFMSHIRLGMLIDLAIVAAVYLFLESKERRFKVMYLTAIIYLLCMMVVLSLVSGLVLLTAVLLLWGLKFLFQQNIAIKVLVILLFILVLGLPGRLFISTMNEQLEAKQNAYNDFKKANAEGRPYICFDSLGSIENGYYVFRNIQMEDLRKAWNARVPQDSFSYSPEHNLKRYYVLLRYLSSAAIPKDANGVKALQAKEVEQIQQNITNVHYAEWWFLHKRIYELVNEYADFINHGEVNGHSFALRVRYWRAALIGISQNPLFGEGAGDGQAALNNIYKKHFPEIAEKYYLKPHNQFLSIALEFGVAGLLIFLCVLIFPMVYLRRNLPEIYIWFSVILILSFITEDTLGTQAGMGYYAIFNSLFCTVAYFKKQQTLAGSQENH